MGGASLNARFCRAGDLRRGMQILSYSRGKPRFLRIRGVTIDGDVVIVRLGKQQETYPADRDVHVLDK